jgi:hypothetical protein
LQLWSDIVKESFEGLKVGVVANNFRTVVMMVFNRFVHMGRQNEIHLVLDLVGFVEFRLLDKVSGEVLVEELLDVRGLHRIAPLTLRLAKLTWETTNLRDLRPCLVQILHWNSVSELTLGEWIVGLLKLRVRTLLGKLGIGSN